MQVEFLQTSDKSIEHKIKSCLEWCHTANFGVAYATYKAYTIFQKDFERFLREKNGRLKVLFDVDKMITSPEIIKRFSETPGDCECKIYATPTDATTHDTFHPKFYFFSNDEQYSVIIGSSNFTQGGIQKNIEANVCITGKKGASFDKDIVAYFKKIWENEYAVNVLDHPDFLKDYIEHHKKYSKQNKKTESEQKKLKKALGEKAKALNQKRKQPLSENFAYLLGLLTANGELDFENNELRIFLDRRERGKEQDKGFYHYPEVDSDYRISQKDAHDRDIEKISDRLLDLLIAFSPEDGIPDPEYIKGLKYRITIPLSDNSPLLKELKKYNFQLDNTKIIPRIPPEIANSQNEIIIKSFLKGYCDLKSRIAVSDGIYNTQKGIYSTLRMGIPVSSKYPELLTGLVSLFKQIGIEKTYASNPKKRNREFLIRPNVNDVPYDLMGTHWRRILLKDFQNYINNKKQKT